MDMMELKRIICYDALSVHDAQILLSVRRHRFITTSWRFQKQNKHQGLL